jgi:hypothetical protein
MFFVEHEKNREAVKYFFDAGGIQNGIYMEQQEKLKGRMKWLYKNIGIR